MTRTLRLYHRRGCHLCDEMLEAAELVCRGNPVKIEVIDIDTDPQLVQRYGLDIPVLVAGDTELCRHRLDRERLAAWLRQG